MEHFGTFIRNIRRSKRIGLREFCSSLKFDSSQWSKIERGVLQPPKDQKVLSDIGRILGIKKPSHEWSLMLDLAALGRGRLPNDIAANDYVLESLPVLFRTIRGDDPTEEELRAIVDIIKHRNQPDEPESS